MLCWILTQQNRPLVVWVSKTIVLKMKEGSKLRTPSARVSFVRVQIYQQLEKFPKETWEPFLGNFWWTEEALKLLTMKTRVRISSLWEKCSEKDYVVLSGFGIQTHVFWDMMIRKSNFLVFGSGFNRNHFFVVECSHIMLLKTLFA